MFFAAQKLGCVPVNVNYRYVGAELAYLLDNSDAAALVFHGDFAPTVAAALPELPRAAGRSLLQVDDGDEPAARRRGRLRGRVAAGATRRRRARREPSGDDLLFALHRRHHGHAQGRHVARSTTCTGRCWQIGSARAADDRRRRRRRGRARTGRERRRCPRRPLMHGTGLFIALSTLAGGGTVVLVDDAALDADAVWDAVERETGAACSRSSATPSPARCSPRSTPQPDRWDLSSLRRSSSSGVTWSPETKQGLLATSRTSS